MRRAVGTRGSGRRLVVGLVDRRRAVGGIDRGLRLREPDACDLAQQLDRPDLVAAAQRLDDLRRQRIEWIGHSATLYPIGFGCYHARMKAIRSAAGSLTWK